MNHPTFSAVARVAVVALAVVLAACGAQTPEDRVAELRADHDVILNSFQVLEQPTGAADGAAAAVDEPVEDEAAEEEATEGETAATVDDAAAAPTTVRQDVLLDMIVRNLSSDGGLPGLTLDVEQADGTGTAKAAYRIYVDTSAIGPGGERAITHRLEDVDFEPGDGFHVEIRQAIPPEQRSDYREFSEMAEPS